MEKKEKKHELKKLKIEHNYKTINWTQLISIILICLVITIGISSFGFVWLMKSVSNAFSNSVVGVAENIGVALTESPEIAFALSNDIPEEAVYLSLLKQMDTDIDIDFNGYFTTVNERSLEKVNLSCIDEYRYFWTHNEETFNCTACDSISYKNLVLKNEERIDQGCVVFDEKGDYFLWKCPLRNCQQREVIRVLHDEFIPTKIAVHRVKVGENN